ncbi:MAG: hypothetical protein IJO47_05135 [Clostridia bacterium]|nr:hypothetical protein [Clostridia bacterium]
MAKKKKKAYPKCFRGKPKTKSLCSGELDRWGFYKSKCTYCRDWRMF